MNGELRDLKERLDACSYLATDGSPFVFFAPDGEVLVAYRNVADLLQMLEKTRKLAERLSRLVTQQLGDPDLISELLERVSVSQEEEAPYESRAFTGAPGPGGGVVGAG
jgi:hypothetical protein